MQPLSRVGNHSNRSRRHLLLYHLLRSNQVPEQLHVEVQPEEKGVRDAFACDALDSHQRGIPTNECTVERKDIIDSRAVIFESSARMDPSQLGRNETDLNTTRLSEFSTLFGQIGVRSVLDRIIDEKIRTGRDCSCGDEFVVTNCIENATSKKRSGQERKGIGKRQLTLGLEVRNRQEAQE